jgi:hypothetical protein
VPGRDAWSGCAGGPRARAGAGGSWGATCLQNIYHCPPARRAAAARGVALGDCARKWRAAALQRIPPLPRAGKLLAPGRCSPWIWGLSPTPGTTLKGHSLMSSWMTASLTRRPIRRLASNTVFVGFIATWFLAASPTRRSLSARGGESRRHGKSAGERAGPPAPRPAARRRARAAAGQHCTARGQAPRRPTRRPQSTRAGSPPQQRVQEGPPVKAT